MISEFEVACHTQFDSETQRYFMKPILFEMVKHGKELSIEGHEGARLNRSVYRYKNTMVAPLRILFVYISGLRESMGKGHSCRPKSHFLKRIYTAGLKEVGSEHVGSIWNCNSMMLNTAVQFMELPHQKTVKRTPDQLYRWHSLCQYLFVHTVFYVVGQISETINTIGNFLGMRSISEGHSS